MQIGKKTWLILNMLIGGALSAPSQQVNSKSALVIPPMPQTTKQFLRDHGIEPNAQSLITALSNKDAQVREIAAAELANEGIVIAVPDVKLSLANESDPTARRMMSLALYKLSPKEGDTIAVGLCGDQETKDSAVSVARTMVLMKPDGKVASACIPTLLTFLRDSTDVNRQAAALSTLILFRSTLQPAQMIDIQGTALELIKSKDLSAQAAAAQYLVAEGSAKSIDAVKQAATTEPNTDRRSLLSHILQAGSR